MRRSPAMTMMMRAAEKAGRGLVRDFGEVENLQVSEKGPSDFVSIADHRAERVIREELQRARPEFGFVMEESGEIAGRDPEGHRWVVDPLDGTLNFLHGLPHFAISIALEKAGEVIAGVVYQPLTDEMYWAERGGGAFLRDRRLRVSSRRKLTEAVFGTGIPFHGHGDHTAFAGELRRVMPNVAGVRRFGAAALDLAYVAAGRFDGFWERGLSHWDFAAGVLIVREAGGFVTDLEGDNDVKPGGMIAASNGRLHPQLLELLRGKPAG